MKSLISILIILFISCSKQPVEKTQEEKDHYKEKYTVHQETIGDCNYIIVTGHLYSMHGFGIGIIHAADCKNPIHKK